MSAFLNPVRAADNIGASPDRVQEFDNGDDHPDKRDGDHCDGYDDDNIDKGEVRLSLEKDQVGLNFPEVETSFLAMSSTSKIFNPL